MMFLTIWSRLTFLTTLYITGTVQVNAALTRILKFFVMMYIMCTLESSPNFDQTSSYIFGGGGKESSGNSTIIEFVSLDCHPRNVNFVLFF